MKRLEPLCARLGSILNLPRKSVVPLAVRNELLEALSIKVFSPGEIQKTFDRFKPLPKSNRVCSDAVKAKLKREILAGKEERKVDRYIPVLFADSLDEFHRKNMEEIVKKDSLAVEVDQTEMEKEAGITLAEFTTRLAQFGEKLDPRIWPIAASFFLTGTSLGIVVPCMPLLVSELGITPSQFGFVISSFALAKLISNIPSTHYVDIVGRKPLMVAGLGMCAIGLGGIGMSLYPGFGYPWIIGCRVISGVGVSAFVSGSFMYLIDISTHLNRARTNAPASAGFNAGLAIGPAMGGVLVELVGISYAYFLVGGMFAGLALLNQAIITETIRKQKHLMGIIQLQNSEGMENAKISAAFEVAYRRWKELFSSSPDIRNVLLLNTSYWFTLSGAQLTLLPLLMVGPVLNLSVSQIATCFGMMSITSFLLSQPLATLCDKYDKVYVSCGGCLLLASSCLSIPMMSSFYELLAALVPLAVGSTIINTAPTAHMANICAERDRSQAVSLLRTVGDIGFLGGASTAGLFAGLSSVESAMMLTGGILVGSSLLVARQHRNLLSKLLDEEGTNAKQALFSGRTPGDDKKNLL